MMRLEYRHGDHEVVFEGRDSVDAAAFDRAIAAWSAAIDRLSERPSTTAPPTAFEQVVGDPDSQHRPTVRWRYAEDERTPRSVDERARAMAERVSRRVAEIRRPTIDEWIAEQAESSGRRVLADLDKADRIFGEAQAADEAETYGDGSDPVAEAAHRGTLLRRSERRAEAELRQLAEETGADAGHLRECAGCRSSAEARRREGVIPDTGDHVARLQAEVDTARAAREAKTDG